MRTFLIVLIASAAGVGATYFTQTLQKPSLTPPVVVAVPIYTPSSAYHPVRSDPYWEEQIARLRTQADADDYARERADAAELSAQSREWGSENNARELHDEAQATAQLQQWDIDAQVPTTPPPW